MCSHRDLAWFRTWFSLVQDGDIDRELCADIGSLVQDLVQLGSGSVRPFVYLAQKALEWCCWFSACFVFVSLPGTKNLREVPLDATTPPCLYDQHYFVTNQQILSTICSSLIQTGVNCSLRFVGLA